MEPSELVVAGLMIGAAGIGLLRAITRREPPVELNQGMTASGLDTDQNSANFTKARHEFDKKLAQLANHKPSGPSMSELAMKRLEEEERKRLEIEAKLAEKERQRAENEAKARREAEWKAEEERLEAERLAEEERIASERQAELAKIEAERQAEMAAAEEERQKEVQAARAQRELEARTAAEAAMADLRERLEREGAKSSDVQISLVWNNYNDLDLHVVCPSKERIHGGNKMSKCGGELDVDANVKPDTRKPVENVVWPEGTGPGGTYEVYVHHYKKHAKRRSRDPTKFQVIVNAAGEFKEFEGSLTHGDPIMKVCEFTIDPPEVRAAKKREEEARIARELAEVERKLSSGDLVEDEVPEQQEEAPVVDEVSNDEAEVDEVVEAEGAEAENESTEIDPEIADLLED